MNGNSTDRSPVIETGRLILYPISDAEMAELVERESDPELRQAYAEMLQGCRREPQHRLWHAVWQIELKARPGMIVGDLSFKGLGADGMVELGYGLREGCCGKGYMTEAVTAISAWALSQEGVTRVEAETAPDNLSSQRVLISAGYHPTGRQGEEGPRFVYGGK
jgi:RimJ/RimL family protein N-acetyltransferase